LKKYTFTLPQDNVFLKYQVYFKILGISLKNKNIFKQRVYLTNIKNTKQT